MFPSECWGGVKCKDFRSRRFVRGPGEEAIGRGACKEEGGGWVSNMVSI